MPATGECEKPDYVGSFDIALAQTTATTIGAATDSSGGAASGELEARIDLALEVGQVSETVTVSGLVSGDSILLQ